MTTRSFSKIATAVISLLSLAGAGLVAAAPATAEEAPALMTWPDLLARNLPRPDETLLFGPLEQNSGDLWLPTEREEGSSPPVVIMIHGGCWQKSIADRTLMNYAARALADAGFAVWNIEYRGVDEQGGGYPGTFQDVALAGDVMRDLAVEFNLDLDRTIAYGHSAGGHLAVWLASRLRLPKSSPLYTEDPVPLTGVVNTGGLADLAASAPVTLPTCLAAIEDTLIGRGLPDREDPYADTSPDRLLPIGTPIVSINGDRDGIAPPSLGEAFTEEARAAGDTARTVIVPNTGHVELIAPGTAAFDETIAVIRELTDTPSAP
ncbi:MAG: alpha/beta hydrolase [Pseudomonadota bacterium]